MRANLAGLKCVCDEIMRAIKSAESSAIFLLVGDIGAGKTTLVREFAEYVGIKESVTSPTFSLLHIYNAESNALNSSLGTPCGDLADFGHCADSSPVLRPKSAKNSTTSTANTRICDLKTADSAPSTQEANSTIADEFLGFCKASDKDKTKVYRGSEPKQSLKSRCESEFATTIYHYDLYQKGIDYALDLGLLDLLEQRGIHFVEWGDRRLFEIIKDAFENIFILQITKAKNDRIYELKREF